MPTLFKPRSSSRDLQTEAPGSPVHEGGGRKSVGDEVEVHRRKSSSKPMEGSRTSQGRVDARREFLKTTTKGTQDELYTSTESLPSLEVAYNNFLRLYPKFSETTAIDDIRERDYYHLDEDQHVCMDYCGFGLFSYHQNVIRRASASFGLAYISANLPTHALYGTAEQGTIEHYIRQRVMEYLNINDNEYTMVFTASRGSAFKLLAESYPFNVSRRLLTVYDFESDAVNWMIECAKQKGAKVMSASFKWPSMRIGTTHLKKLLQEKKKKSEAVKGMFVFPVQSRLTGAKYSYQWMSEAQQNKWHVLLDASALGPKDMDTFGLSLFRPDFIVSSFYKVFGIDPTGFGCLFIKNSALPSLQNSAKARAIGMVRIVSPSNSSPDDLGVKESENEVEEISPNSSWRSPVPEPSSFSGPFFPPREMELETQDDHLASNHESEEAGTSNGGIARHVEQFSYLVGPNSEPWGGMGAIKEEEEGEEEEEAGSSHVAEYGAQLTKSRYYSEMRASEIEEEFPNSMQDVEQPRTREIEEEFPNSVNEVEQLRTSEIEEEFPNSLKEIEQLRVSEIEGEFPYSGYSEQTVPVTRSHEEQPAPSEIQEVEDADAIEAMESRNEQIHDSQSGSVEPVLEIDKDNIEITTREYRSVSGGRDWEIEDAELPDESLRNEAHETGYSSDGYSMVLFDNRPHGGVVNEEVADLVDNYAKGGSEREYEAAEFDVGGEQVDEDHNNGQYLHEMNERGEELLTSQEQQETSDDEPEVKEAGELEIKEVGEQVDNMSNYDKNEDVEGKNSLREDRSPVAHYTQSIQERIASFERRKSFRKHTGQELSEFQEMGVQGLVEKFQSLHSGSEFKKELEGSSAGVSDLPLYKRRASIGNVNPVPRPGEFRRAKSVGPPDLPQTFVETTIKENISNFGHAEEDMIGNENSEFSQSGVVRSATDLRVKDPNLTQNGLEPRFQFFNSENGEEDTSVKRSDGLEGYDHSLPSKESPEAVVVKEITKTSAPERSSSVVSELEEMWRGNDDSEFLQSGIMSSAADNHLTGIGLESKSNGPENGEEGSSLQRSNQLESSAHSIESQKNDAEVVFKEITEYSAIERSSPGESGFLGETREFEDEKFSNFGNSRSAVAAKSVWHPDLPEYGDGSRASGTNSDSEITGDYTSLEKNDGFEGHIGSLRSGVSLAKRVSEEMTEQVANERLSRATSGIEGESSGNEDHESRQLGSLGGTHSKKESESESPELDGNEDHQSRQLGSLGGTHTKSEHESESLELRSIARSTDALNSLREPTSVDEDKKSAEPKDTHYYQHLQNALVDRDTASESGEENYITILPRRDGDLSWDRHPDTRPAERGSFADNQTSPAVSNEETGEFLPARDTFSPQSVLTSEPSDELVLESSWRSPGSSAPTLSASILHSAERTRSHYETLQEWKHGRSDLRSNRTLSRDVEFEDEMFSCRGSIASESMSSIGPSSLLAEELARIDKGDSDDDSFLQSQFFSGSLHGSNKSRNINDDFPSASYERGESLKSNGNGFDDNLDAEAWEGNGQKGVPCKGLDLADSIGLSRLNHRVRYLINWLVNSLLKLQHPSPEISSALVRIYGPKVKYDRGGSIAFNMYDMNGGLIQPLVVQKLADRSNISLGVGKLCNIVDPESSADFIAEKERLLEQERKGQGLADASTSPHNAKADSRKSVAGKVIIPVVTVSLGLVTSFEDVYRLWCFLANFLDADFVSKEVWRYHSLNQQTIVM